MAAMDDVFRALADPTRRSLLDELFKEDGQTLSALEQRLPMTRFGVMKHLKVLEEAGLVVTRRRGREKLHFLNAVPIRLIHDRWVSKYSEPWAATLTGLKSKLEDRTMEKVFEIYIKTSPDRLWEAIVDPDMRRKYNFGVGVASDWTNGSHYAGSAPGMAEPILDGGPSRSTRRGSSCRASMRAGATTSRPRGPRASRGRSSRWPIHAGSR
jgi:DNA-binding transcriptional ArsR family regulator